MPTHRQVSKVAFVEVFSSTEERRMMMMMLQRKIFSARGAQIQG
jgi:hypothetical protein